MNRFLQSVSNRVMGAFVDSGVQIDDDGRLCLPDGLCPERVHRFIEICLDRPFDSPRQALAELFVRVGIDPSAVRLLDSILDERGDVDFGAATRRAGPLLRALPQLKEIPVRFRRFLVDDLDLASPGCTSLEQAVVSAREEAAARVGCEPTWDAILEHGDALRDTAGPWRASLAAA